jgi:hypothetical protein
MIIITNTDAIEPGDDSIDMSDVVARIIELEEVFADEDTKIEMNEEIIAGDGEPEELVELHMLQALRQEVGDEAHLIHEDKFEDHARELAEDIHGAAVRDAHWPFDCIDWSEAATALHQDYSSVDFGGITYWYRQH